MECYILVLIIYDANCNISEYNILPLSRNTKAAKDLHKYKMRVSRLAKKVRLLKNSMNRSCNKCSDPSAIIKDASKYLNPWQLEMFKSQLKLSGVEKRGRRYSR